MNVPELSSREISLRYFQRYEDTILRNLRITQDPDRCCSQPWPSASTDCTPDLSVIHTIACR